MARDGKIKLCMCGERNTETERKTKPTRAERVNDLEKKTTDNQIAEEKGYKTQESKESL
jgi:hypothetical protein